MSKTTTKKGLHRKHTSTSTTTNQTHPRQAAAAAAHVAEAKKKGTLGNISAGSKLRRKTRKKLSHQQTAEARDTLDAEFRDLRAGTMNNTVQISLQQPDGTVLAPPPPRMVAESTGFGASVQTSEESVQDLAGILNML